ncbi:3161_t:CDS:2, partial [Dentiscutata erythropus]
MAEVQDAAEKTIKPSKEIVAKVKDALNHYNPYNELMSVFEIYGKFLPKKVILGHKIYRVTRLIADESLPDFNFKEGERSASKFMAKEYNDILSQWEKCMSLYGFDSSYFVSIDDKLIMKDQLEKWIKSCSEGDYESLQIPESFNVREKVLYSGIIPVNIPTFSYRMFKKAYHEIQSSLLHLNIHPNFEADIQNYRYKIELDVYYANYDCSIISPMKIDDSSPMEIDDSLENIFTNSDVM